MSQSRAPLPMTASPTGTGVGPARPDARVARFSRPRSARRPPAPSRLPHPTSASRRLLTSDSWGRREPGRGRRGRPRQKPRAGRARLGVGGRAGRGRGVPRPSPCAPAALGRMTQQPKQRQEEAAGEGGEEREGQAGSGGGMWEGRTGGRRSPRRGTGTTSPHLPHLRQARRARSPRRSVCGWGWRASGPAGTGIPEAPSFEGTPALGVGGTPLSRQPVCGLIPIP